MISNKSSEASPRRHFILVYYTYSAMQAYIFTNRIMLHLYLLNGFFRGSSGSLVFVFPINIYQVHLTIGLASVLYDQP